MEIEKILIDDCLIIRVRGELDHHQADQLRQVADEVLDDGRAHSLVLNLQGLSFMDSSGVGVILGRYKRIQLKQGSMAICDVPQSVLKVLEISGVPRIIPFLRSEADALRHTARSKSSQGRLRKK